MMDSCHRKSCAVHETRVMLWVHASCADKRELLGCFAGDDRLDKPKRGLSTVQTGSTCILTPPWHIRHTSNCNNAGTLFYQFRLQSGCTTKTSGVVPAAATYSRSCTTFGALTDSPGKTPPPAMLRMSPQCNLGSLNFSVK